MTIFFMIFALVMPMYLRACPVHGYHQSFEKPFNSQFFSDFDIGKTSRVD